MTYEVSVRQRVTRRRAAYDYLDPDGRTVMTVRETDRRAYEARDASTRLVLRLVRPEGARRLDVLRPDGSRVGQVEDGSRRLLLRSFGADVGHVARSRGTTWDVCDAEGQRVGRVRKEFAGVLKGLLTTADTYALRLDDPVPEPLRTLALVTPVALDAARYESNTAADVAAILEP